MQEFIKDVIVEAVGASRGKTTYRTPLVGFAPADDPGFATLKEAVGPDHLLPQDLPAARSVVADHFQDLGLCDVCGKCAAGPCAE